MHTFRTITQIPSILHNKNNSNYSQKLIWHCCVFSTLTDQLLLLSTRCTQLCVFTVYLQTSYQHKVLPHELNRNDVSHYHFLLTCSKKSCLDLFQVNPQHQHQISPSEEQIKMSETTTQKVRNVWLHSQLCYLARLKHETEDNIMTLFITVLQAYNSHLRM